MIGCLLIRADAETQIGSGHLMRCLALAQAWQGDGGSVTFLSYCDNDALRDRIETGGFNFVSMDEPHPESSDLKKTLVLLDKLAALQGTECWLVLDGYHFDSAYQRAIRAAGYRLLVVDDMAHLTHYHADVVLNQNIYAERLNYHCDSDTKLLLGTDYAMLRTEFQPWKGWQREISDEVHKVLVSLGGGDPDNVTLKVIEALQGTGVTKLEVRVVVGPANPHLETLQRMAMRSGNIDLLVNATNMPELMAWADVAVCAGGTTSWELAFMGLPSIVVVLADNQRGVAEGLDEAGATLNLGWHEQVSEEHIVREIQVLLNSSVLRREMSLRGLKIVDGDGSQRVVSELKKRSITLRTITPDDCRLTWEWANEPEARGNFFSPEPIPWTEHVKWFETKLHDPQCLYYIALDSAGDPIGQVRYDLQGEEAMISVNLDAKSRGSGYGSLIIQKASKQVLDLMPVNTIHAYIKEENKASIRAFTKAGYEEESMSVVRGQKALHVILTRDRNGQPY